jgi:hypothetical protein
MVTKRREVSLAVLARYAQGWKSFDEEDALVQASPLTG